MPTSRISAGILAGLGSGIQRGGQAFAMGGNAYDQGFEQSASLQSKLAQALSVQRANEAKAAQDAAETRILEARPDLAEEQAALQAGVTVPQVRAARAFTRTGRPSALEVPDLSNLDVGPPPSVAASPEQQTKIGAALRQMLPVLTNVKDNKADDLANAAKIYQQVDGAQAVIDGKAPVTNFGRAMAAAQGKPLFNAGTTGAVLDNFAGTLDTANPLAGSTIALRGAQAGAQKANAAQSYAAAGASSALADQRRAVTASGRSGPGGKVPIGYRYTTGEDGEARLEPIPGGPKDPNSQTGKPLPASAAKGYLDNQTNLRRAEKALELVEGKSFGDVKGDKEATGMKGYLPNAILSRVDPAGVDTRAAISDLGSLVLHDRSGAAVTAAEFPRLAPFIPTHTDDQKTSAKKLRQFVQNYRAIVEDAEEFYKASGYNVPKISPRSGGTAATPAAAVSPATPGGFTYLGKE